MTRRFLLAAGLILLVLALIGVGMLSQRRVVMAYQTATLTLDQSTATTPMSVRVGFQPGGYKEKTYQGDRDLGILVVLLLSVLVIVVFFDALSPARKNQEPALSAEEEKVRRRRRAAFALGVTVLTGVSLVAIFAVPGYLQQFAPDQPTWPRLIEQMTRSGMQTQAAGTQAAGAPFPTPIMMTQAAIQTAGLSTPANPPTPAPPPEGALAYELFLEWPTQLEVTRSAIITISLRRLTPGGDGSPGSAPPLSARYRQELFSTFDGEYYDIITYGGPHKMSDPIMRWQWRVTPYGEAGERTLNAAVVSYWEPVSGQGPSPQRVLMQPIFNVIVIKPPIPTSRWTVFTLIAGVSGVLLCLPWLHARFRQGHPA